MGVELPGNRRDLVPAAAVRAVRRHVRHPLWPTFVAVAVAGVSIRVLVGAGDVTTSMPLWMLPPLLAVAAWGHAARRSRDRARATFWIMAAAAGSGVLVYAAWLRGISPFADAAPGSGGIPLAAYLLVAPHLGLTAGAVAALGPGRSRVLGPTFAVEALLLLLAGGAATLRLVVEPTLIAAPGNWSEATALAGLQTASLVPVLVAALLVLRRGSMLAPRSALLLLLATLSFAGAVFFSLTGLGSGHAPFTETDPSAHMWTAGWLVFAASGFAARDVAATATAMLAGRRAHDALRKLIVPGVALFLAVAVLDLGFGREPRPETVVTVGLLGLVLALRTGHVFRLVDRDAEQRRQLAHTRALVDVTHALAGTMELDATLRVISEAARSVFGTRGAGIELLSADGHSLETRYVVGLSDDLMGVRFPVAGSFTGWVVRHGEPRTTVDPSRDPYVQRVSLDYLGRSPVAAAPIRFHDRTIGVLYACIRDAPFDPEELQLMSALAEQAAIAIQNAR
ncbi:MAG: GAF domain-containing protein, partial [Gemmatimonadetes bacterium]|nr:GAF domain-containing protein [Gemmatimonadota bacterium]NIQ54924.1 GAF domain-containing protein [Gemmatimonadota bacterium]NIU75125.1 GAF domain-containing protein [Gammaproteobacteria bacterium]NIX44950.1 GAF domain-containing protein [Gemmatimonadota bacterium]NIY09183.1 GAF domain-containing protein [Gemmatimonadota bacterium]